jgi:hypothetical protein
MRGSKPLPLCRHENIIWIRDVMVSPPTADFEDVYIVTDLYDTDLANIIAGKQVRVLKATHIPYRDVYSDGFNYYLAVLVCCSLYGVCSPCRC